MARGFAKLSTDAQVVVHETFGADLCVISIAGGSVYGLVAGASCELSSSTCRRVRPLTEPPKPAHELSDL
jgi:hypothetical protein